MAGKYAVYFPYKAIDALEVAGISDSDFRLFVTSVAAYSRDNIEPEFNDKGLKLLFNIIKPELIMAKQKYEAMIEYRSKIGSLGGASKGNTNACKNAGKKDRKNND